VYLPDPGGRVLCWPAERPYDKGIRVDVSENESALGEVRFVDST
jgi:hypothetical protein